jgi:hypothetical protein
VKLLAICIVAAMHGLAIAAVIWEGRRVRRVRFAEPTAVFAGIVSLLIGAHLVACPSKPTTPSDQSVYQALVQAGCLKDDDAGLPAVIAEHQLPTPPPWLNCLYSGGTVAGCGVPCSTGEAGR